YPPAQDEGAAETEEVDLALGAGVGDRAHRAPTLVEAHSHCLRRPSARETCGSQASSERIRVVSALVRRWSPGTAGSRETSRVRPEISSRSAIASFIEASSAPPTL